MIEERPLVQEGRGVSDLFLLSHKWVGLERAVRRMEFETGLRMEMELFGREKFGVLVL